MGAYGSPDTGNLYTEEKQIKKYKKFVITTQTAVLIVLYLILLMGTEDKYGMTIAYVGVMSVVYSIVFFISMIVNLFRKKSANKDIIRLLITFVVFIACMVLG